MHLPHSKPVALLSVLSPFLLLLLGTSCNAVYFEEKILPKEPTNLATL